MKRQRRREERAEGFLVSSSSSLQSSDCNVEPPKKRARCVSPEGSDDESVSTVFKKDFLGILAATFTENVDYCSNPFEPVPIREDFSSSSASLMLDVVSADEYEPLVADLGPFSLPFHEVDLGFVSL